MVILVDMDGVLADFDGHIAKVWQRKHPDIPFIDIRTRKTFYVDSSMPKKYRGLVAEIYLEKGFFLNLPPIPGGWQALEEIAKAGHTVKICTAPLLEYHNCIPEKLAWIEKHLGFSYVEKTILARDKTLVRGHILIDDKPEVTGELTPEWEHIVFDNNRAYNQGLNKRYLNWRNYKEVLGI